MLIDIKPRVNKLPQGRCEIDWSHPLAFGLKGGLILNEGAGTPLEIVTGQRTTFTASPPGWRSFPGSRLGLFFTRLVAQAVTVPFPTIPSTGIGQSWAFGFNVPATAGTDGDRIFCNGIVDDTNPKLMWTGAGLATISLADDRSVQDASCTITLANIVADKDCHVVISDDLSITLSPTMFRAYFNGVSATLVIGANGAGTPVDPAALTVGGLTSVARSISGVMYYFYKYGRVVSQTEAVWLKAEPYAFFKPKPAVWYSFTAGQAAASTRPPSLALTGVGI